MRNIRSAPLDYLPPRISPLTPNTINMHNSRSDLQREQVVIQAEPREKRGGRLAGSELDLRRAATFVCDILVLGGIRQG